MAMSNAERVTQLINSRRGKKSSITKRINHIDLIVADGGSRTQLVYLIDALTTVQTVCDELATLDPDADVEYVDKENLRIDSCVGEAKAYLECRRDDPLSTGSLCEEWVQNHSAVNDFGSVSEEDSVSAVTKDLSGLQAGGGGAVSNANTKALCHDGQDKPGSSVSQFLIPAHASWLQGFSGTQLPPPFVPQHGLPSQFAPQHGTSSTHTQQTVPHHGIYSSPYIGQSPSQS